eukprot:scaffold45749_cov60-Phaeocystis_antarctica.AAC.10
MVESAKTQGNQTAARLRPVKPYARRGTCARTTAISVTPGCSNISIIYRHLNTYKHSFKSQKCTKPPSFVLNLCLEGYRSLLGSIRTPPVALRRSCSSIRGGCSEPSAVGFPVATISSLAPEHEAHVCVPATCAKEIECGAEERSKATAN